MAIVRYGSYKKVFRRRRGKYARRARKYGKRRTGLKKLVNRLISRKLETKDYVLSLAQNVYEQNTYTGAIAQTLSLIPAIAQGTGNGQRIADKITVTSMRLKTFINLYQPGTNGHQVRVVIFSVKDYNADIMGSTLPSIEMQNFFRLGGSSAGPAGYLSNEGMLPINTQRINVHYDKTHFLGTNVVPVNSTSGHVNGGDSGRPFINIHWRAKKPQIWKYDENAVNSSLPTNHNLFMSVFCCDAGGAAGSGITQIAVNYNCVDIKYKDA